MVVIKCGLIRQFAIIDFCIPFDSVRQAAKTDSCAGKAVRRYCSAGLHYVSRVIVSLSLIALPADCSSTMW